MPRHGHRHRLVLYAYMLNRWWKYTLGIGIVLLAMAAELAILPIKVPQYYFLWTPDWVLWAVMGAGAYAILLSIFLIAVRNLAYIQPFDSHLRLIIPFLRVDISYRRILKSSSVEMQHLFPVGRYRGLWQRLLRPLANQTAIVLDLNGWPLPRWMLGLFLSPFFFPDKSARLALLVPRWMDFSMDMDNFRSNWIESQHGPGSSPRLDLLASISKSRK
jgi:hypothetical protein